MDSRGAVGLVDRAWCHSVFSQVSWDAEAETEYVKLGSPCLVGEREVSLCLLGGAGAVPSCGDGVGEEVLPRERGACMVGTSPM